jgi:hypothetical protein
MLNEEVLLRYRSSDDTLVNCFSPGVREDSAVIRTAHVGKLASSCRSSLAVAASVVSGPDVWAVTVNAEKNNAATVGKCIVRLDRDYNVEP